jgi:hypothetical protein
MSKVSRESAPDVTDYGPAEDRGAHFDGYAVVFSSRTPPARRVAAGWA